VRDARQIVEHDQIGNQVIVSDELPLLVPHILRDHTVVAAEGNPLHELVEPLFVVAV
jgi:hypothetical protein